LTAEPFEKITGAVRGTSAFSGQVASVLIGNVDDPLVAKRSAFGYIDFRRNVVPTTFASDTVIAAEFRFVRSYTYGDTLGSHTFVLSEMNAKWDPTGKASSYDLGTGTEVMQFSVSASDSLVVVRLPEDWIGLRRTVLNSTGFDSLFHGFRIAPVDARAVFGFGATASLLRIGAKRDTVDMISDRIFTRVVVESRVAVPDSVLPLIDGMEEAVRVDLSLADETAANGVLNRVALTIPVSQSHLAGGTPANFVRPALQQLSLYGVRSDGTADAISSAFADTSGSFEFVGLSAASETTLLRVAQAALLGSSPYTHFRLLAPATVNTFSGAFLRSALDGGGMRAVLTVIPK
jgi:hypothetical protein